MLLLPQMETSVETDGPYTFCAADLQHDRLRAGIEHTLKDFETWRDANPDLIAEHVDSLTARLQEVSDEQSLPRRLGRLIIPGARNRYEERKELDYIHFFGMHNLGMELDDRSVDFYRTRLHQAMEMGTRPDIRARLKEDYSGTLLDGLGDLFPEVKATTLIPWMKERMTHLTNILPEEVIAAGTMGNVLRVAIGTIAIAAHDVMDEPLAVQVDHMKRVIPGAYVYGASYALVDEVMQSETGRSIPKAHKDKYHERIQHGLATGGDVDTSGLPDHPLAEELASMYDLLRQHYPISEYPYLYHAAESMYLAQHRDTYIDPASLVNAGGIRSMYPDMIIKSTMTRVIADLLGKRGVSDKVISHTINEHFGGQMRDDFGDRFLDSDLSNWTPFTVPYHAETDPTNPLYDLFAYDAYIVHRVCDQNPKTRDAYIWYSAIEIGTEVANHPGLGAAVMGAYPYTNEIGNFIRTAAKLSSKRADLIDSYDIRLLHRAMSELSVRRQTDVDPRTFVSDRLSYINEVVGSALPHGELLSEPAHYAIEAGGKRLRPALTLMLAEGLGVASDKLTPLLQSIELFHTSSLVFDDLPAQDNASRRRDKPTTHVKFGEWSAQLAGLSTVSRGFGVLAELNQHFPAHKVNEVVAYAGSVMGIEGLCKGQAMDLLMGESDQPADLDAILEMYHYKTSLAIEASLVPLMLLLDRANSEIDLVKKFARHAGIAFQIRDDILDMTSSAEEIGKDTQNDVGKANVARLCGLEAAQRIMEDHLAEAVAACQALPFNTDLLTNTARYFVTRKK
jgi:geranylgeranyl pyrophosphate synthase